MSDAWLMSSQQAHTVWPSPRLIRAARALVGIDQEALAAKANVTRQAVIKIEADESDRMDPRRLKILQSLQRVFEDEFGIEFFAASEDSGEGVRFRKSTKGKSVGYRPVNTD
jgi:DNA-binding XRE family transcriptional regulator